MDTLRECNPTLLRVTPERDTLVSDNLESANSTYATVNTISDRIDSATIPAANMQPPDSDRFASDFTDPLFPSHPVPYARLKRLFDLVFATAILIPLSPFMLIFAALVKLTSRGPIIFKQVRVGQGGRYFYCYKFRSMCVDAEQKKLELLHLNEATGPVFKIKNDPRITRVGAFMRKFSIDEWPQFFNVLKGDMSVVGPRPPIPSEVDTYSPYERQRLAVLPGLTCLWQVSGRSNITFERWVELDLEYIETMSFFKDLKIICKTVPAVLTGSGAH